MEASDAAKLRDLESENAKLKRLLAEAHADALAIGASMT
jgi:putative transposase